MSDELVEIRDEGFDVDDVMRSISARARERRHQAGVGLSDAEAALETARDLRTLESNWDPEAALPGATRGRWLKRWLLWAIKPFSRPQTTFNAAAMSALSTEAQRVSALSAQLAELTESFREVERSLASLQTGLEDAVRRFDEAEVGETLLLLRDGLRELSDTQTRLGRDQERLNRGQEAIRHEVLLQRYQLETALRGAVRQPADMEAADQQQTRRQLDHLVYLVDRAFRGGDDEVRARLGVYVSIFAERKASLNSAGTVLDIGCGRGLLLELLSNAGLTAIGVELNQEHVRHCQLSGLNVIEGNGLDYLDSVPDSSLLGVVALQVVEHMPLPLLVQFVTRCREKIQSGGLLVLESPNPRNLITSATEFYLDLTHRNPIHPQALAHLVTALGFLSVDTKDLNPPPPEVQFRLTAGETQDLETENENWRKLNSLLFGARDYAVIATK